MDVILHGEIDPLRHKASVKDGILNVKLFKQGPGMWGRFHVDVNEIDDEAIEKKTHALEAQNELEQELREKRRDRKSQDERFSTRKQMALEEAERTRIEDLKLEEKHLAEEDMYAAFAKQEQERAATEKPAKAVKPADVHVPTGVGAPKKLTIPAAGPAPIAQASKRFDDIDSDIEDDEENSDKQDASTRQQDIDLNDSSMADIEDDGDMKYVPPPRSVGGNAEMKVSGKVGISFTPRIFPTPMRASKAAEEEDWIAKNRKHLKKHGVFSKNLAGGDVTEEDSAWLKAKGDDFYRNGDCKSAINAYSAAIDVDEGIIPCYSNRSACYLRLGMDTDCVEDCSVALQLLETQRAEVTADPTAQLNNSTMTVKLLLRRGISRCRLGFLADALQDYTGGRDVLANSPDISLPGMALEQVTGDVQQLEKIVYADEKKKEADVAFGQREITRAVSLYTEVLEVIPEHVGCLSNRSACKIALGDLQGCIEDCNLAVQYLQSEPQKLGSAGGVISPMSDSSLSMLYAVIPPPDSEKRKNWLMKTVVRRGAVSAQLGDLDAAIRDYGLALSVDPTNTDLQTDLQNLVNTRTKRAQHGVTTAPVVTEQSVQ